MLPSNSFLCREGTYSPISVSGIQINEKYIWECDTSLIDGSGPPYRCESTKISSGSEPDPCAAWGYCD
jgi:hypothetical protein